MATLSQGVLQEAVRVSVARSEGKAVMEKNAPLGQPRPGWFAYHTLHPHVYSGLPPRDKFKEVVLVASFPRTGSTWLYKILEQYTGVESCAVYDESGHRSFFGGRTIEDVFSVIRVEGSRYLAPGDNCATKTHFPHLRTGEDANVRPSRLILLVRNPIDSVLSIWDYERRNEFTKPSPNFGKLSSHAELARKYEYVRRLSPNFPRGVCAFCAERGHGGGDWYREWHRPVTVDWLMGRRVAALCACGTFVHA